MSRFTRIDQELEVWVKDSGILKALHYRTNNYAHAISSAQRAGYTVVRCCKVDREKVLRGNLEKLNKTEIVGVESHPALAIEDRIFDRQKRRMAMQKFHDNPIDNE